MTIQNQVGGAADIIKRLDEIFGDTEKTAAWLRECKEFEARGWISIETDRLLNGESYAV